MEIERAIRCTAGREKFARHKINVSCAELRCMRSVMLHTDGDGGPWFEYYSKLKRIR